MATKLCISTFTAVLLASGFSFAEPDPGAHRDKKLLHNSDQEERSYKVCHRNEKVPVMTVYVGKNARAVQLEFGECREFKSKQISVDKHEKERKREG